MTGALAKVLTHARLRRLAGPRSYERGIGYFAHGRVLSLAEDTGTLSATVRGTHLYQVALSAVERGLAFDCTCPLGDDGTFCKHCVAAGLAWLARGGAEEPGAPRGDGTAAAVRPAAAGFERPSGPRGDGFAPRRPWVRRPPRRVSWRRRLADLEAALRAKGTAACGEQPLPPGVELIYTIDVPATIAGDDLVIDLACRRRKANGAWTVLRPPPLSRDVVERMPDAGDRRILALLLGAADAYRHSAAGPWRDPAPPWPRYGIPVPLQETLVPLLCRTDRFLLRAGSAHTPAGPQPGAVPVRWDDGAPWELHLEIGPDAAGSDTFVVRGALRRGEERVDLSRPVLLLRSGFAFLGDTCAGLEHYGAFAWTRQLRGGGPLRVPRAHADDLLASLLRLPVLPRLALPAELRYEEVAEAPRPRLVVRAPVRGRPGGALRAAVSFEYRETAVDPADPARGVFLARERLLLLRDPAAEQHLQDRLRGLGFRAPAYPDPGAPGTWCLAPRLLPRAVRALVRDGWRVEARGRVYRNAGQLRIAVTSGTDWFDLAGAAEFDGVEVPLPEVLAALRRGESLVPLGDGTYGILPEEWLARYGLLAGLGASHDGRVRFQRGQLGVLDALLASGSDAAWDEGAVRARDELHTFERVVPRDPPAGFTGRLRGYQREGLGWLDFLGRFGWGGCLADDMGLGKTVQTLALLASRRAERPALVVVPKSLVFNWKHEAARFTPALRVLEHTGAARAEPGPHFRDYDVVLTTYGTLRRDAAALAGLEFDYVVLDEAQAIKNAGTQTAKAARALRGGQRLALSGTPVENHLGELWSLFEFLNPGMLGSASVFRLAGAGARDPSPETRAVLARALRPFILRRTKERVLRELPPKSEQTLYCELEAPQRAVYDDLREYYRRTLLARVARDGLNRAKIQVLEALLRLRQAACHPGLIDRARRGDPGAKLDVLLPRLGEAAGGGHKALVFSQFTRLLGIVRDRLDRAGVPYEYLDGRTRDRAARVRRFEEDGACRLFLISLKAGGLGLNLAAADYVFLLDPWWNPAAETQAIDRAHRIGQTRPVHAYRLIARDTVEEKVLALQDAKRELAGAVITEENSLVRTLRREDLELLLS